MKIPVLISCLAAFAVLLISSADAQSNKEKAPYDLQFMDTMVVHHQSAIAMAQVARKQAQREDLRKLAAKMVTDQRREIQKMKTWRKAWYPAASSAVNMDMTGMANSMRDMDPRKMEKLTGNSFDLAFIDMMTRHHEGAIEMAGEAQKKANHPQIVSLAKKIITKQQEEIKKMNGWKAASPK